MKMYLNYALFYAVSAMAAGVFYREFTKWNNFSGITSLSKVHVHLFALGMMIFLLVALFDQNGHLNKNKTFRVFMLIYNMGVLLTAVMMFVRGIPQVLGMTLSHSANAAVAGMAGIGHMLTGTGIILLLVCLKKRIV